jgi:NADH-quinone oxidoreductase subunit J
MVSKEAKIAIHTMISFFILFSIFSSFALLSSILVITSKNPVYSVLFLVLAFCNVAMLLFLLSLEFLPITFLVVYVGAIAVLFLFVLMMLNIRLTEMKETGAYLLPMSFFLFSVFILCFLALIRLDFTSLNVLFSYSSLLSDSITYSAYFIDFLWSYSNESNMRLIGKALFTEYAFQFVIVGYILLLAMIGAIILTLYKKFVSRNQNVYFQVLRNFDSCLVFYE